MKDGMLMFTKATNWKRVGDVYVSQNPWWRRFGVCIIRVLQGDTGE